jgi:hypothetical protein
LPRWILWGLALEGEYNFLKIDVQGYELEVLRGATNSLQAFEAVLLEVAIIEINEGAPLLHEVTTFMAARGFIASEICEIHRRPLDKAMSQIDVIFVRRIKSCLQTGDTSTDEAVQPVCRVQEN